MADLAETFITQPEQLAECCAYLARLPRFGFDTEFVGEGRFQPQLCLVQIATPERLFVIDALRIGPLDAFWQLVVDPAHQVVVHSGREEIRLCQLWSGRMPTNLFDLQIAAGLTGWSYPLSYGKLVSQILGENVPKQETLTEWRDRPLTAAQLRYAFDDVRYLLPIWEALDERLRNLDRLAWAEEEFASLIARVEAHSANDKDNERWRKLRGLGTLNRRGLAIVRELFFWRERVAERRNRPPRTICRDDLLVEIAARNPKRRRDLSVVRGLPKQEIDDILEIVRRANALPLSDCPRNLEKEQDPIQVPVLAGILLAVVADWCGRSFVAPSLAATAQDIKALIRARIQHRDVPDDCSLNRGWRRQHLLPLLQDVLEGRRRLRIHDPASASPLHIEPDQL
ncbi:MAG: ribonuclease D [Gemmatales bacterium]|nr:MAG: ribonuclease D [Gemmatales bacterium]